MTSATIHYNSDGPSSTKPDAPANVKAALSGGNAKVSWSAVSGATKYAIYRRVYDASAREWSAWKLVSKKLTHTDYTDTNVETGTYYAYRVRAYNGAWSGYSSAVKARAK